MQPQSTATKVCTKCGDEKPLDAFWKNRSTSDGRERRCIACLQAYNASPAGRERQDRYNHSQKGRSARSHYKRSAQGKRTAAKRLQCPEVRQREEERLRKSALAYYYRNHEERVEKLRQRNQSAEYHAKRAVYRARQDVRALEQEYARQHGQRRRAAQRLLPATLTSLEWDQCLHYFGHCCAYCGATGRLVQEHFIPIDLGGPYSASNIVPACYPCNGRKGSREPSEFCSNDTLERVIAYFRSISS